MGEWMDDSMNKITDGMNLWKDGWVDGWKGGWLCRVDGRGKGEMEKESGN